MDPDDVVAAADPAMVVVTVAEGDERSGCLVGFHTQASIDPWRYVVLLSVQNHTHDLALRAGHLAVHLLADSDHVLAERFGGHTADEGADKFAGLDAVAASDGRTPRLAGLAGFLGCVVGHHDLGGDHTAFVLEAVESWGAGAHGAAPAEPLRLGDVGDVTPGHPA